MCLWEVVSACLFALSCFVFVCVCVTHEVSELFLVLCFCLVVILFYGGSVCPLSIFLPCFALVGMLCVVALCCCLLEKCFVVCLRFVNSFTYLLVCCFVCCLASSESRNCGQRVISHQTFVTSNRHCTMKHVLLLTYTLHGCFAKSARL